ncbi:MAG: hypothetical protein K8H86_07005 [Ignavibacteriaceae bacterium]|nr:hypothetical protein [Ignavibacteriaceae bacterium]
MKSIKILLVLIIPLLYSCAEKFSINEPKGSGCNANLGGDTVFVSLSPAWTGFNRPQDIYAGREPFIYVADTDNDRIVMLNLAGKILGTRSVKKPIAISQDFRLNLIVCAQFDTVVNSETKTYSAVYKYDLVSSQHSLETAPEIRLLPRVNDLNFPARKYTGVVTFYDNSFYVARTGPNNTSIFDPDNSILIFKPKANGKDSLIGRVANIDPLSSGLVSANGISSLTSLGKRNIDFVATLTGNNNFKAQWYNYQVSAIDEKYVSRFTPNDGVAFAIPNKFLRPEGSWVDNFGNIYIADAGRDSVYKFNQFGEELESFGGVKYDLKEPYGVTVFDRVLYVTDTGNNRIVRYILSTDVR